MRFRLENDRQEETKELPEPFDANESLQEAEAAAESYEDCGLAEGDVPTEAGEEVLEATEESFEDCAAKVREMQEDAESDGEDDFSDCGKNADSTEVSADPATYEIFAEEEKDSGTSETPSDAEKISVAEVAESDPETETRERDVLSEQMNAKFEEVLSKERGTEEYSNALREYNALRERREALDAGLQTHAEHTEEPSKSVDANVLAREGADFHKQSELDDALLRELPDSRKEACDRAFRNAPPEIVHELNRCAPELAPITDSGYGLNEDGETVKNGSCYSPLDSQVRMNEAYDDDEYAEVLPHELSHFLDHQHGWESSSPEFTAALSADLAAMDRSTPEGRARFNEMLDDAFNTGAAEDRAVSDLLFGAFGENGNDPEIAERFDEEDVLPYWHSDAYWMGVDENGVRAPDGGASMRHAEVYAEIGAIRCLNDRQSNDFIDRYFPNTAAQFDKFYETREQEAKQ